MKNNNNNNKMESFHEVSTTVCSLFEQESTEGLSVCVCVCVFRLYDKHCDFMLNIMKLSDTRLNTLFLQIAFMKNILR